MLTASERLSMGVWNVEWAGGVGLEAQVAGISACVAAVLGPLSRGLCHPATVEAQSDHLCPAFH